jgi:predicted esterase
MNERLDFIHLYEPATPPETRTLLLLHGTGGDEHDLIPVGRTLVPGAGLLSPRGQVLERGMPRFFRRLAEGVFDLEDLKARTADLAQFVTHAARHYALDPSRIVAAGFSNGANIAASLLLLQPEILSAAALFSPMVPIVPDPLPDLRRVAVFISGGRRDHLVPQAETERLATLLEAAGAAVTLRWTDGGHALTRDDVAAAADWAADGTERRSRR